MLIKNLTLTEEGGFIVVSAECKIRHWKTDVLYFRFKKNLKIM